MASIPKNKYMGVNSTQELINLLKADNAKKQDIVQFTEMPSPIEMVGRVVQYVGETGMEFTNGHFYHSDGFKWDETYKGQDGKTWAVVDAVPSFADADYDTIYFVYEDGRMAGYLKGDTQMEKITSNSSWLLVRSLPAWAAADPSVLYLLLDGGVLRGYVKDPDNEGEWFEMAGGSDSSWEIVPVKPSWAAASPSIIYFVNDNGILTGYIKDVDHADTWFEIGGAGTVNYNELENAPTINGIPTQNTEDPTQPLDVELNATVQKYPESEHYDPDAEYPDDATPVHVNEVELKAFTDDEIRQIYEDIS